MKTLVVRTICDATVEETWTLRVTDEQAAELAKDSTVALTLLEDGELIDVTDKVSGEHNRDVVSFDVEDDGDGATG